MSPSVPFATPARELRGHLVLFDGRNKRQVSFAQLANDVARTRDRLAAIGLQAGAFVGILGENCYEWVVHDLALLSMGCVTVCFPEQELGGKSPESLADQFDLSLLLVTGRLKEALPRAPWIAAMDEDLAPSFLRRPTRGELRRRATGTDLCSVIFSSGTSGRVKALLLSRAGVESTVETLATGWCLSPEDAILVALPLSVFQQRLMVYAALRRDTVVLLTNSANLFRSFKALRPTVIVGPPALFEAVERRSETDPPLRRRVRFVLGRAAGGAPAPWLRNRIRRRLFRDAHDAFGGRARALITGSAPSKRSTLEFYERAGLPLFEAYGMAEIGFIAWNLPGKKRLTSVGRPIEPGSVTIADDGEILVSLRHPQALGYFGDGEVDEAKTFLPEGRVATGDLGRLDGDGYLYITGRKKNVIVLQSGEKLQPEALETQVARVPGVQRAIVLGGGELPGLAAIVAVDPSCSSEQETSIRRNVDAVIQDINKRARIDARIVRLVVTKVPFQPETGLVTRNLKLDRAAVYRFFERDLTQTGAGAS